MPKSFVRPPGPGFPVRPSFRGRRAPMGLIIGVVVLIIIVVIVIIAVVLSKKDSNTLTAEEQLRKNCIDRGDAWNATTQICTSSTPPGGGGGSILLTPSQQCERDSGTWDVANNLCFPLGSSSWTPIQICAFLGGAWNTTSGTCASAGTGGSTGGSAGGSTGGVGSETLTPLQQCTQAGGYIGSDGTCITPATCTASGGTFSTSMLKCSPYTPTSCATVKGTWNADLLDCLNIPSVTGAPTYTCVCGPRGCGNGAYGASPGQTDTGVSATSVESSYRPCVTNIAGTTGWVCTNTATGANYCA